MADIPLIQRFQQIAKRDGKTFSQLVVMAMDEYYKKHAAGNSQYQLTNWSDEPEFKAFPAFASNSKKWMEHIRQSQRQEIQYCKNQGHLIREIASRYLTLLDRGRDISTIWIQL